MPSSKPYKILSLDGGGSWSILQIKTLQHIYQKKYGNDKEIKGHDILKDFDLVVANSGGSIVLCALAENYTLDETIALFKDKNNRDKIFRKLGFFEKHFPVYLIPKCIGLGARYSSKSKYAAFKELFPTVKEHTLKDLPSKLGLNTQFVVTSFDAMNNQSIFFRSHSASKKENDICFQQADNNVNVTAQDQGSSRRVNLVEAIHGASNAPVNYFDFPAEFFSANYERKFYLWDGALGGFNNPVAAGIIEAFNYGVKAEDISVLSIGTGFKLESHSAVSNFYKFMRRAQSMGFFKPIAGFRFFFKTVLHLAKTVLYEPPDWANFVAYNLLFPGSKEHKINVDRFVRLSPIIFDDNDVKGDLVDKLNKLDMDVTKQKEVDLLFHCFDAWEKGTLKNQPIRKKIRLVKRNDNSGFKYSREIICKIGHDTFEKGVNTWINNNP